MKKSHTSILLALFVIGNSNISFAGGHDAGYDWAARKGIDDPSDCYSAHGGGNINNSPSFSEGCLEYLNDEGLTDDSDELKSEDYAEDEDSEEE